MSLNSEPPLVSWQSLLQEDTIGPAADQAGSSWMRSPTRPMDTQPVTAMGAADIQDFSKHTADSACLDEGGEGGHRLEKARCIG